MTKNGTQSQSVTIGRAIEKNHSLMRKLPLHPLLFTLYPVFMLLSNNISQVLFLDTVRVFYAAFLLAIILFSLSYLILRDWQKAGLIASLLLALFYSYGHVFGVLQGFSLGPVLIGRILVVLPVYLLILIAGIWVILSRSYNSYNLTKFLNMIGLFLLFFPLYTISFYYVRAEMIRSSQKVDVSNTSTQMPNGGIPTIYYIVLDMHARQDVLREIYGYDNAWFIDSLEEMGFYVADESTSNYSSTLQSISSSLNMEYINYLEDMYGADSNNREPLGFLLAQNKITGILRGYGYKTGALQTNLFYTEFRDAGIYIKPTPYEVQRYQNFWALNSFEGVFLQTTMARVLYDLGIVSSDSVIEKTIETPYQLHRLTILNTVEHLPDFADKDDPYFVFAHIISPHPPYIFGRNGETIKHTQAFSLSGPGRQNGGTETIKLYVDQLHYTDRMVLVAVKDILSRSKTPPIIIIQGDHGPVSYTGEDEVVKTNMKEQHAILNAYYFPGQNYDLLYPSITPVNSFRVVLNTFFRGNYEVLPDLNYFIPHARPYDFIDVTDRVHTDPLVP